MELSKDILKYLFPFFKRNESVKTISQDLSQATNTSLIELWQKIKSIFIEEFEVEEAEVVGEFGEKEALKYILNKALRKNEELKSDIAGILQKLNRLQMEAKSNYNAIDAGRDVQIGDNRVYTQNINNQGARIGKQNNIQENSGDIYM